MCRPVPSPAYAAHRV